MPIIFGQNHRRDPHRRHRSDRRQKWKRGVTTSEMASGAHPREIRRVGRIRESGMPASVWRACVRIPVFVRRLSRAVRHGDSLHGCGERRRHGSEPEDSGPSRLIRHPLVDCRSSSLDVARRSHRPSSRDPATQAPLTPGTKCRWRLHSAAATCDCPRCVIKVSRRDQLT